MKIKNATAELLSIIWEAVDCLNEAGKHEDAQWITKQTINLCNEIRNQSTAADHEQNITTNP